MRSTRIFNAADTAKSRGGNDYPRRNNYPLQICCTVGFLRDGTYHAAVGVMMAEVLIIYIGVIAVAVGVFEWKKRS